MFKKEALLNGCFKDIWGCVMWECDVLLVNSSLFLFI